MRLFIFILCIFFSSMALGANTLFIGSVQERVKRNILSGRYEHARDRSSGRVSLHWAVELEHLDATMYFIENSKVDIDITDKQGRTPLHVAVLSNSYNMSRFLLLNMADMNKRDKEGRTALHLAVMRGNEEIVKLLLQYRYNGEKVKINAQDQYGKTALILAVQKRYESIVKLLLDYGANTEVQDAMGKTAIYRSLEVSQKNITLLLLKKGANPNAMNQKASTPLIKAISIPLNLEVISLLLKYGADIEAKDAGGFTLLYWLAKWGKIEYLDFFLEKGAFVTPEVKKIIYNKATDPKVREVLNAYIKKQACPNSF